jgi:hypothetical protein
MPTQVLYKSGSGSEQFELVKQLSPARFEVVKRQALRYMRKRAELHGAIAFLEDTPWEFWNATNDFGDDFNMLYLPVSMDTFIEVQGEVGIWRDRIIDGCPAISRALDFVDSPIRLIAVGFNLDSGVADIPSPTVITTSAVVEDALNQAETLIGKHGAGSALDRVHTAFHAYLESKCRTVGPGVSEDAPITTLFSYLRQHHPALAIADPQEKQKVESIFRGLSKIIDAVNDLRNTKSLAHPNSVLADAEATLAVNVVRAMLRYVDMRLR